MSGVEGAAAGDGSGGGGVRNGFWVWYSILFGAGGRCPVNGVEEEGDS